MSLNLGPLADCYPHSEVVGYLADQLREAGCEAVQILGCGRHLDCWHDMLRDAWPWESSRP